MTTQAEGPTLTIDELAARSGVTVRTVRFYSSRGLLPPPEIGPRRVGRYGGAHVARLALIEELQLQGMTLAAIERYLRQLPADLSERDLAVHRAVVSSWAPEAVETVGREELERLAGRTLSEEELRRLVAMDMIAVAGEREAAYRVDSAVLRLGVRLLDVPLSQEVILAARTALLEHSRAAAQEMSRLLRDAVTERDARDVRSLSARMEPLVVQALLTAFQRSLKQELREWLEEARPEHARGGPDGNAAGHAGGARPGDGGRPGSAPRG
ncbi:MerR family transcriptional regulator [Streptomyces sp. NPDC090108]|uniref:MerR family transcriptional regulator n=1 Tax=Streptomyces sp. NPDC090108 TaxID=3365947 RepID=UPI003828C131